MYLWRRFLYLCVRMADCAYFFLHEGQKKTFARYMMEHQVLSVRYNVSEDRAASCRFEFQSPDGTIKHTKQVGISKEESQGWVAFMCQEYGEHKVSLGCGQTNNWWTGGGSQNRYRWTIILEAVVASDNEEGHLVSPNGMYYGHGHYGGSSRNDKNGAVNGRFDSLDWQLRSAAEKVQAMVNEGDYERREQLIFSDASEQTLVTITVLKMIMLTFIACNVWYQIYSLRAFFKQQKLI